MQSRSLPLVFLAALWLALCAHPLRLAAQEYNPGYELGAKTIVPFHSEVLKEERRIEINVPKDFDERQASGNDVIYVLDGVRTLHFAAWDYLRGEGFLPKNTILVGLLGPSDTHTRLRDFTPTSLSPDSGGAAAFLSFLSTELIPYINKTYRSDSNRSTLVGGSMGGLFALYTVLNEPTLFKAYLALDPSVWWDNRVLLKQAPAGIAGLKGLHRVLWVTGREGAAFDEMGVAPFESVLKRSAPPDLIWKCETYSNETHLTTWYKGLWDGLKFAYGGFYDGGIGFKPRGGIILKDRPFKVWCYQLSASSYIRYSTDGQEPTLASPTISYENTFAFTKDTSLTLKSFSNRPEYDSIASGEFKVGETLAPIERPKGVRPGGLRFKDFEGEWETPPDFSPIEPVRSGLAGQDFDLRRFPDQKAFACILNGYVEIPKDGYYIIELGDEGGSRVYLGSLKVIGDHYDSHGGSNYMVPLRKGFYPIRIEYFHRKGGRSLEPVYIRPEDSDEFPIPLPWLYSRG